MWLRRQDELNEARPTERFSTAIRLLSGRAGMERRYAKDLRARSTDEGEQGVHDPDAVTDSVDLRAFAVTRTRPQTQAPVPSPPEERPEPTAADRTGRPPGERAERQAQRGAAPEAASARAGIPAARRAPDIRRERAAQAAAARARRTKALARRRRTTTVLFVAFTLGAVVAAVGGLAFLWAPGVPAVLLSAYIAYLRSQERRRFAYQMDRRQAEVAAQRLRERERQPRRRPAADHADPDEPEGPEAGVVVDPGLTALAADRRALVEQTDHAEWVDQQRERQRRPDQGGDSWDPVPVPLPTYVTAPVAPRATGDVGLGAPDTWSSARSSAVPAGETAADPAEEADPDPAPADGRTDARRAASARRSRERGRTPLFDQY